MSFELTNMPIIFSKSYEWGVQTLFEKIRTDIFDDILICNNSKEEHWKFLKLTLEVLKKYQLYVKESKCKFRLYEISYLSLISG